MSEDISNMTYISGRTFDVTNEVRRAENDELKRKIAKLSAENEQLKLEIKMANDFGNDWARAARYHKALEEVLGLAREGDTLDSLTVVELIQHALSTDQSCETCGDLKNRTEKSPDPLLNALNTFFAERKARPVIACQTCAVSRSMCGECSNYEYWQPKGGKS